MEECASNTRGSVIDLSAPWARYSFLESLTGIGDVPQGVVNSFDEAVVYAKSLGIGIERFEGHGKLLTKIFDLVVEPRLIQPTFIYCYPLEVSPLSRKTEAYRNSLTDSSCLLRLARWPMRFRNSTIPGSSVRGSIASWLLFGRATRKPTRWMMTILGRSNTGCLRQPGRGSA